MKLTDIEIKGKEFEVEVTEDGKFRAVLDSNQVVARTLDELKSQIARRISRGSVKLNIPFVRWDNDKGVLRKGTITGIHASNRNLLVKWDGQKGVDQEYHWSSEGKYIKPEVAEEYVRLAQAAYYAEEALHQFNELHQFNAMEAVQKALGGTGVAVDD